MQPRPLPVRAGLVIALLAVALLPAGGAGAAAPEAQAWWYVLRNSQIPIETPVPPSVDENGLYVAAGPNGAIAIAAIRAPVGDSAAVTVTLDLTDTSGDVVLGACRTAAWSPVQAGNWDERPETDCEAGSVAGVVADDATSVTFDVGALAEGGVVDVVITPGINADGSPASFTASIAPPDDGTVATRTAGTSVPAPSTPPSTTAPPAAAGAAPTFPSRPTTSPPSFQPAAGIETLPPPDEGIEIPPQVTEVATPAPTPRPRPAASSSSGGSVSDQGRVLALGLMAALGVGFFLLRGQQGPVPAPLLALRSSPAVGPAEPASALSGIGRFAKERVGRPPPLT